MDHLTFKARVKADGDAGIITAYASTFGNIDLGGDICVKGCFTQTIKDAKAKERGFLWPMMWAHNDMQPPIGVWTSAIEDQTGLKVTGKINLDSALGKEIYSCVKQGSVGECSIGYSCAPGGYGYNRQGNRELKQLDLTEISLLTVGYAMNPEALLVSAKSRKEGRTLSKDTVDMLKAHVAKLREVLGHGDLKDLRKAADDLEAWYLQTPQTIPQQMAELTATVSGYPTYAGYDNYGNPKSQQPSEHDIKLALIKLQGIADAPRHRREWAESFAKARHNAGPFDVFSSN